MKKIIAITAILALASSLTSAELLKNFKYDGELVVHSLNINDGTDFDKDTQDETSQTKARIILGVNFDLTEDMNTRISVAKQNRRYGEDDDTVNNTNNVNDLQENIAFTEAFVDLKNVVGINHRVGRQYYGEPQDIIAYFGPLSWPYTKNLEINSVDGWYGEYAKEKLGVQAIFGKLVEGGILGVKNDENFYGFIANYDWAEYLKPGVYYYHNEDYTAGARDRLSVYGVKLSGKYDIASTLSYKVQIAQNAGSNSDAFDNEYKGMAYLANVAYDTEFADVGKFNVMGEYASGSGDDDATDKDDKAFYGINSDYRPGIIMGGTGVQGGLGTGIDALTNLSTYNFGVKFSPKKLEKLALLAKYYDLKNTKKIGTVKDIGNETDFVAEWNHSENVNIKAHYAIFTPDTDYVGVGNPDDKATQFGADFTLKF